jgi:phosphoribosylformylglycinamidine synthase
MDLKMPGGTLALVRAKDNTLESRSALHRQLAQDIRAGRVLSCHDISDGGLLVAAAEMCIASGLGLELDLRVLPFGAFDEVVGAYLVELNATDAATPKDLQTADTAIVLGQVSEESSLSDGGLDVADQWKIGVDQLTAAWRGTLDW